MGSRGKLMAILAAKQYNEESTSQSNPDAEPGTSRSVRSERLPDIRSIEEECAGNQNYVSDGTDSNTQTDFDSDDSVRDINYEPSGESSTSGEEVEETQLNFTDVPSTSAANDQKKLTRKRKRAPETWKKTQQKSKRNLGQSYVSAKGKKIGAKVMKESCSEKCRMKCRSKFTEEERSQIFSSYYNLGDVDLQRNFLNNCISTINPVYRNPKANSERSKNLKYSLYREDQNNQVCKTFFKNTLAINNRTIFTTTKKTNELGFLQPDKRGKHGKQKRIDERLLEDVRSHIASFPRMASHYCRSRTNKEYLDGSLNISGMYRLYREKCSSEGLRFVKLSMYAKIVNTETNLAFHQPKKDQCSLCENYTNASEADKANIVEKYKVHLKEKNLSREEKKKDLENKDARVYCFDLQAVLPCPCGDNGAFFYKKRLAVYNYTVFNVTEKLGYCYTWDESLAKRGSNEIASFLYHFITSEVTCKDIIFYSDNCTGQNKNRFVCAMYLYCIQQLPNLGSITHKFLVSGHTQNEGDAMHATIEKERKRILRGGPIFVPSQWIMVLKSAKKSGNPYKVNEMGTTDVFDFKRLATDLGRNYKTNSAREKIIWNDIKIIKVMKSSPNTIQYKYSYEDENFKELIVDQTLRKSERKSNTIALQLHNAYSEPPVIDASTKQHLLDLCKANAIKQPYWSFYENLKCSGDQGNDQGSSSDEDD